MLAETSSLKKTVTELAPRGAKRTFFTVGGLSGGGGLATVNLNSASSAGSSATPPASRTWSALATTVYTPRSPRSHGPSGWLTAYVATATLSATCCTDTSV